MSNYLSWDNKTISDFSPEAVTSLYNEGYVFTREHKGSMYKTRSLRLDLGKFEPNSENRRILKKVEGLMVLPQPIPLVDYSWQIHKLGKDYYEKKFGAGVFSASKIKELVTSEKDSNYNTLLEYKANEELVGYAITYMNQEMLHYAYPFYDLDKYANNYGMGMMLNAILLAQDKGLKYVYLGSATRPADVYKLQFSGLEWFDGNDWQADLEALKTMIAPVEAAV